MEATNISFEISKTSRKKKALFDAAKLEVFDARRKISFAYEINLQFA